MSGPLAYLTCELYCGQRFRCCGLILRLVASVVMILSQLYFAKACLHAVLTAMVCKAPIVKVFADLTFLTSMYNQWTLQRHQRMTQTRSALESMNIPKQLIQKPAQNWFVAVSSPPFEEWVV